MNPQRRRPSEHMGQPRPECTPETFQERLDHLRSKPGWDEDPYLVSLAKKYEESITYWTQQRAANAQAKGIQGEAPEEASAPRGRA